jgi:hypothetical protein
MGFSEAIDFRLHALLHLFLHLLALHRAPGGPRVLAF